MKRFFVISFLAAGYVLQAQSIGNSPYASFGIGDVKYDNTTDINAMGGISTAYISDFTNSYNFTNPAANINMELTSIKVEATNENNFFKTNFDGTKVTKHSTYLSNISIAFPLSKSVKFGLGFQPYSSKNYSFQNFETNGTVTTLNTFTGTGTVSTVQAGLSYQIIPGFALGLRSNFYFGNLFNNEEITNTDATLINGFETRNRIKTFDFTAGTVYQKKLKDDHKFTAGATYTFGATGNTVTAYKNSTYFNGPAGALQDEFIIESTIRKENNLFPMQASVGVGYGKEAKWFLSGQLNYKQGQSAAFLGQDFQYKDSYKASVGGWYLPDFNNFRNYLQKITYRYGAYYEKGNLYLNNKNINEFALTGGVTVPFGGKVNAASSLDLGLEIGKRGTLQNNLINQNFVNLKIGINFADKWFNKRYYD
ncbi:hypothetical protein [Halpernia frigidisoli]|uniref:Long-chain fatty acid transport protein n=1 Tax=Halpernia frigidisoli TaxID=1125876 RepID=A0A1I3CS44_9FLAO|nr:hypothetical protein [Halpernia frigidisoli]SFH77335.1 hypothetical protein SAMN05443292_0047 [Halpernia frigidisoli]